MTTPPTPPGSPEPITLPPLATAGGDGTVRVDSDRALVVAKTRFANKLADSESEAANWQTAYETTVQQRNQELAAAFQTIRRLESEVSSLKDQLRTFTDPAPEPVTEERGQEAIPAD